FCGLARPESFWASLAELDIAAAGRHAFADHRRYSARDLRRLRAWALQAGADGFITTAKDAMKLPQAFLAEGVAVLEMEMEIPELATLLDLALKACAL
ncbi:MAG: tetraacyldisaccharide 4'-kinase, partial [Terriglobales bacterium]